MMTGDSKRNGSAAVMKRNGFAAALAAGILFGVGGTFAQFLFSRRGVAVEWLVPVRLLGAGGLMLLLAAAWDRRAVLAVWRTPGDAAQLILFGIVGMMPVQYTYFAAIAASNGHGTAVHGARHGRSVACARLPAPAVTARLCGCRVGAYRDLLPGDAR